MARLRFRTTSLCVFTVRVFKKISVKMSRKFKYKGQGKLLINII
jgi:hypothetical protein